MARDAFLRILRGRDDGTGDHPALPGERRPEGRRRSLPQALPRAAQGELRHHRRRRADRAHGAGSLPLRPAHPGRPGPVPGGAAGPVRRAATPIARPSGCTTGWWRTQVPARRSLEPGADLPAAAVEAVRATIRANTIPLVSLEGRQGRDHRRALRAAAGAGHAARDPQGDLPVAPARASSARARRTSRWSTWRSTTSACCGAKGSLSRRHGMLLRAGEASCSTRSRSG